MPLDLTMLSAGVIAFGIIMYVILDGFDLGVGVLYPFAPDERSRDVMINSIAPVWDGNETWLVLGGATLFAAFPTAYALLLPVLYAPIMAMLLALILRGVAFEFRSKAGKSKPLWTSAFAAGSTIAAFSQGAVLGAFIEGFRVSEGVIEGGAFAWLGVFPAVTGVALVVGYALLGATWLILKTDGALQAWARRVARWATVGVMAFMAIVSVRTALANPAVAERWFGERHFLWLWPVPLITAATGFALWGTTRASSRERAPFWLAVSLFLLGYLGLAISLWPHIVPHTVTLWDAASPASSQVFLLIAVAITLPMVLGYTAYTYWVFRGKTSAKEGYAPETDHAV